MNKFLLGGVRLPLLVIMLAFMTCIISACLFLCNLPLATPKDPVMLGLQVFLTLVALVALIAYCQLRQVLDDYLDCEQRAEENIQQYPTSPNPLHFITGQIHRSREQELAQRIELHRQERAATIGSDTSYDGEPDYDNEAENIMVYQIGLEQQGR